MKRSDWETASFMAIIAVAILAGIISGYSGGGEPITIVLRIVFRTMAIAIVLEILWIIVVFFVEFFTKGDDDFF